MSLEDTIRETCSGLTSIRATDRKKNANALKDFLTRNAVPSLLTNNTLKKTGYSWNHVFDNINDYIIKETEKVETSKSFDTVTAPLCISLLHLCVAGSNKGHAYIKCQKIMDACFIIFDDSHRRNTIGDAYISLLYKHILPVENYLGFISPANWERLLDVAIYVCVSNRSLDDLVKTRLLWLIMKNAFSYCQFSTTSRDYLAKLKKCCIRVLPDQKAQEFVVKIFTLLLESLSLESRLTMCEFSESILPSMLKIYEQSMDEKKKTLLFRLFKTAITIHHPEGRSQNTNGSLAHNWDAWNKNLHSMLEIVCLEVNQVQKVRKQNENLSFKCNDFYHVAASAFYQIFNLPEKLQEDEPCNSAKKIKMFYNKNKSFNDLIKEFQLNAVVWVGIVQIYVNKFGHSITYGEYLSLIGVIEKTISDNNKQMNWDRLEELTCLSIKNMITHSDYVESENKEVVISLLNTCVRNAAVTSTSQKTIQSILQVIINLIPLKYQNVQPLLVSYLEKGVPVNDYTLRTLNCLFNKFYRKTCYSNIRQKCFDWLKLGNLTSMDVAQLNAFLLRLLSNDNLPLKTNCETSLHNVYEIICDTTDVCLLYSEFEYKIPESVKESPQYILETFEINTIMYNVILAYIEESLTDYIVKLGGNNLKVIEYAKYLQIMITFVDSLLKYKIKLINNVKEMPIYSKLRTALKYLYSSLTQSLKSDIQIREKVLILKSVQDIFLREYDSILNTEVREHIGEDCFHCMNDIIKLDIALEDDNYEESDTEFNMFGLKQNCIFTLAAYCRKNCCYRDELLKCILDWDLYRQTTNFENIFNCIRLLNDSTVDNPPTELIFSLMQNMCKDLFRNPRATRSLLRIISEMLEQIWRHGDEIIRKNCVIMVKSYLHRCSENFYPPDTACLVYECVAKIVMLNNKQDPDIHNTFKAILIEKVEKSEYKIRLFCSHLLSIMANMFCDEDMQYLVDRLLNIFVINVAEKNETVLIDEKMNRSSTVLHIFYVLGATKKSAIHKIILQVLKFQNEKSMDNNMVKKVLNLLTEDVTGAKIEIYMKDNILRILHYWFKESVDIKKMPLYLFGFDNMDRFIDEHMTWLIPADVLWSNNGIFDRSNILKQVRDKTKRSNETIIESCFCNIIALCLPHIVIEMYKLNGNKYFSVRETANANRMFQLTRQTLKNDRWSNLFVENLGEIMLLCATHVKDYDGASELFDVNLVDIADPFTYSRDLFTAILRYFGELIDGNIMQYMCENQPLIILNILFKLWNNVLDEKVLEFKVLHLHAYVSFIQNIPLGYTSDAILCTFSCDSLVCGIKGSQNKELVRIYVKALKVIVTKVFNETQKSVIKMAILPKTVSILTIKMEEGLITECDSLQKYLKESMNNCLNDDDGMDVVDFVNFITKGQEERIVSPTKFDFEHKLKTYTLSLSNPSHDNLSKMARFLKRNNKFVKELYTDINANGFSENCKTSLIHQVITFLNNILKTATEDKIIIAACNCLAEIGTYDIKTLVTVPPMETKNIVDLSPKQYFALTVLTCLTEYFFDEDPIVSNKVIKALSMLLKFRDGQAILDFADMETEMLKSLMSSQCECFAEYKIDNAKFDKCNAIDYWIPVSNESHSQWIIRITMALLDLLSSTKNFLTSLQTVCASKPLICGKILPALMGLLLDCSTDIHVAVFGGQINEVFKYIWNLSFDDSFESIEIDGGSKISTKINQDQKVIVQYLLDVVDFIRIQRIHYKTL